MISSDTKYLIEKGATVDDLYALPFDGVDTLYKAMRRNLQKIPNNDMLGTLVGDHYEWMGYKDMVDIAEHYSYGMMALDLAPPIQAEDREWRFIGIQSKNRKEWVLTNLANMH